MTKTSRIHSAGETGFAAFRASAGLRRPVTTPGTVEVVVIGHTGQVGSALVERLARIAGQHGLPGLRFSEGINRSSHVFAHGREVRELPRAPGALGELASRLLLHGRSAVVVDCTADPDLPRRYPEWLRAGIGVVTPNKHGFSGELARYRAILDAAALGRAPLGYSATVGAGLPILSTLKRLRRAGAVPSDFSAVVSGTLGHVFSRMAAGLPLSAAVEDARSRGFTEPDPLEDLSGRDVARKLLIMLREAGLEDKAVKRVPVVDDDWARSVGGRGDVIAALREHDSDWAGRLAEARSGQQAWTYLARLGPEGACVGPVRVGLDSPFARLEGSGNLARIELTDDPETPLEIQGPGAGVAITAGSVFADLVDAAETLYNKR